MSSPSTSVAAESKPKLSIIENAVLERVTYANIETGYAVVKVALNGETDHLLTVVGPLGGAQPGEGLRLEGWWKSHPQYGRQFEVKHFTTILPATLQGIQRYLGSGLIKGVGPVTAERIVDHFGLKTLDVIEQDADRLIEVPGLGPKRSKAIAEAWDEQKAIKEVMVFLQGVGVSTSLAVRIYKRYKDDAIAVVRDEPYRLASDVWGIGFKTADTIAQQAGIPHDSPQRVKAALQYTLSTASDEGHCFLPREQLAMRAMAFLEVGESLIETCIDELASEEEGIVIEHLALSENDGEEHVIEACYLVPFHRAEVALSSALRSQLVSRADRLDAFASVEWTDAFSWFERHAGQSLAPEQADAVRVALTNKVAVLTGGPGCGKSFTVRAIVALAHAKRAKVTLVAPTGRAAKRLSELAGHEASTVHRLLQIRPGGEPAFGRDNPIDADLVVVDEASMLDLLLANKLMKAIGPGTHVLFVGDVDQLPSVGAGQVLRDLLSALSVIPRVTLTHVFRQAQDSGVITNAHRINAGEFPLTKGMTDFFWFVEDDNEKAASLTVDVVSRRLPAKFGLDPNRDVQVLTPKMASATGANALNVALQEALTPERHGAVEKRFGGRVFRVGDKVIQIRNNYEKGVAGVFNGTIGVVNEILLEDQQIAIITDEDERVTYDFGELDELAHAYAITIHRSQGSEYPCVVVPVTTSAWIMLQRNLLYTAVTRAKRFVVLVGSKRAIAQAVRTVSTGRRFTALTNRLERNIGDDAIGVN